MAKPASHAKNDVEKTNISLSSLLPRTLRLSTTLAIATIAEPDILIVDETLSVGDVFFQQKCERRIQHFIESGDVTVLFVSHSMEQVGCICQHAVWIEKGDLRMDGVWMAPWTRSAMHTTTSSSRL